jgi:hypothetical protein
MREHLSQLTRRDKTERELKFKDSFNRYMTSSLFFETCGKDFSNVLYTLNVDDIEMEDGRRSQSLRKLYLETEDPAEFLFAEEYFFDYEHWLRVCEMHQIKDLLPKWRRDLSVKIKSNALREIIKDSFDSNSKTSQQSARFLACEVWKNKSEKKADDDDFTLRQRRMLTDAMKRMEKVERGTPTTETGSGE